MTQHKYDRTSAPASRRTGLDRRWIPSTNHHPERRRGEDRRSVRKRSFTDPFESDDSKRPDEALARIESEACHPDGVSFSGDLPAKPRYPRSSASACDEKNSASGDGEDAATCERQLPDSHFQAFALKRFP